MPEIDLLTSTDKPPRPPTGLGKRGAKLWRDTLCRYELRVDELTILHEACRILGQIDYLADQLSGADLIVRGSMGQPAPHPFLAELRGCRSLLSQLVRQLKLPDDDGADEPAEMTPTSRRAQHAANARWSQERARTGGA